MARQKGIIKLKGKIGDLSFYTLSFFAPFIFFNPFFSRDFSALAINCYSGIDRAEVVFHFSFVQPKQNAECVI